MKDKEEQSDEHLMVERGYYTRSAAQSIHEGEFGIKNVPGLLRKIFLLEAWKKRIIIETGEEFAGFSCFKEYAEAHPPKGLGSTIDFVKKLVAGDKAMERKLANAVRKNQGRENLVKHQSNGLNQPIYDDRTSINQLTLPIEKRDRYNRLLLQLEKESLELYAKVVAGELSVYAAAVQACIYPPRIAINLKDPGSAAQTILRNSSEEYVTDLLEYLREGLTDG